MSNLELTFIIIGTGALGVILRNASGVAQIHMTIWQNLTMILPPLVTGICLGLALGSRR